MRMMRNRGEAGKDVGLRDQINKILAQKPLYPQFAPYIAGKANFKLAENRYFPPKTTIPKDIP
jgi:hypothetical protein